MRLIGRDNEILSLISCYESEESEFVALYGRRRVGKTFLIKEHFNSNFIFYSTGILNGSKDIQLQVWNDNLKFYGGSNLNEAISWYEAFNNLNILVEQITKAGNSHKKVIFLDEIPWMATLHSDFLTGLDYFWNRWASSRRDILLIICGSAASWIIDNILNCRGGLHNRVTRRIYLKPFNLNECKLYCDNRNLPFTNYQIAEAYMIFGGIPYYWSLMKPHLSLYQNVDNIYFNHDSELHDEFNNLYQSLYKNSDRYINVVEALAIKGIGMTRSEIAKTLGISDGGRLTTILKNLSSSGFIRKYKAFGQKNKESLYQLVDFFSMFDIKYRHIRELYERNYWLQFSATSAYSVWSGICFEKVCLLHLTQIQNKLGISGVLSTAYSWRGKREDYGAQIDLVIDRNDNSNHVRFIVNNLSLESLSSLL